MSCVTVAHEYRAREYPPHSHGAYQMIFVTGGSVRLSCAGHSYAITAPSVLLLGNLETHSFTDATEHYERYTVTIAPRAAAGVIEDALLAVFSPHSGRDPVIAVPERERAPLGLLFSMLEEETARRDFPEAADALVRTILIRLYRISPAAFPDPREGEGMGAIVENVRRTLEENLDQRLTLDALGERYHVSVYHLERMFRAHTGYSIGQYRTLCRIAAARELLAVSDLPVGEIAARVGIGDASNFSRSFRRETGLSPLDYRRKYAKNP